jgi:hypothetical protein
MTNGLAGTPTEQLKDCALAHLEVYRMAHDFSRGKKRNNALTHSRKSCSNYRIASGTRHFRHPGGANVDRTRGIRFEKKRLGFVLK